jgi:serine/threonine protein kinase
MLTRRLFVLSVLARRSSSTMKGVFDNIKRGYVDMPTTMAAACRDLLRGMMDRDPAKRMSIDDVVSHPFVTGKSSDPSVAAAAPGRPLRVAKRQQHNPRQFNMGMLHG